METIYSVEASKNAEPKLNMEIFMDGAMHAGSLQSENLTHDIQINTLSQFIEQDQVIEAVGPPTLCIAIVLEGRGSFSIDHGPEMRVEPGTAVVFHAKSAVKGRTLYEANHTMHCLDLRFHPDFLKSFGVQSLEHLAPMFKQNASYKDSILLARPASASLKKLAQDIIYLEMNGLSRMVYLQAKALEILAQILHVLEEKQKVSISKSDEKKVTRAISLLETSYEENWTIARLAREVSLNERKLKEGFHLVVQSTVHQYLEEKRLFAAQSLLSKGESVTDVALSVGYANPSHFSKRFKGRFGVTPKRWRYQRG